LKIYFRELLRERLMFIGFGIVIGSALNTAALLLIGGDGHVIIPAFIVVMLIGLILTITNRGANPYGDLK
jgi:hypothetical protein